MADNLVFSEDSFDLLQDILEDAGELEKRAPYEDLVTTEFARGGSQIDMLPGKGLSQNLVDHPAVQADHIYRCPACVTAAQGQPGRRIF